MIKGGWLLWYEKTDEKTDEKTGGKRERETRMNDHCSKYNPTSSSFKCASTTLNISDLLSHHRDDNAL